MRDPRRKRRSYDEAFKREAVRQVVEEGIPAQQVERELERVARERDILKKAVAIFSTDPDRYTRS